MNKKGSILMISLWILAILVVFAVGLAHRAAINLKLSRYQRDRLKAYSLAMAGVQKSRVILKADTKDVDSFSDNWSTGLDASGKPVFENVEIIPGSGEKFTVKYYNKDKDIYLCMSDEEAKINLNTSPKELLSILFQEFGLTSTDSDKLAEYIQIWRGDTSGLNPGASEYNDFKKEPFAVKEELLIVLECFYQNVITGGDYRKSAQAMYSKAKDLIACYADSSGKIQININTASAKALELLIKYCIENPQQPGISAKPDPSGLLTKIIESRNNAPVPNANISTLNILQLTNPETLIVKDLEKLIVVKSDNFRIISTGEISATGIRRNIDCVFNRDSGGAIVYWHEN